MFVVHRIFLVLALLEDTVSITNRSCVLYLITYSRKRSKVSSWLLKFQRSVNEHSCIDCMRGACVYETGAHFEIVSLQPQTLRYVVVGICNFKHVINLRFLLFKEKSGVPKRFQCVWINDYTGYQPQSNNRIWSNGTEKPQSLKKAVNVSMKNFIYTPLCALYNFRP